MKPDAALELVEAYLRLNGYFVETELEMHERSDGAFRAITDVDVVAVRLPSYRAPTHYAGADGTVECLLAGEVDPALGVATDRCDVIIGEVKRGEVSINQAMRDPRVLHAVLMRTGDTTGAPLDEVVDQLRSSGAASTPLAQVRVFAFGSKGSASDATVVHHEHLVGWLNDSLARHRDLFEITNFSDPVLSLLALAARIDRPLAPRTGAATDLPTEE